MVLAVVVFLSMTASLAWACHKVLVIAYLSRQVYHNPAYALYFEARALNKWGFLYVQYRAPAFWTMIPALVIVFIRSIFVALVQSNGRAQAIGLFILECLVLIGMVYMRPWMDGEMNIYQISIGAVNVINALLFLFFSGIFRQGGIVTGAMGCVFFILNAVVSLLLVLVVLVSSGLAIFTKSPDKRYKRINDDRSSWIKDGSEAGREMVELGVVGESAPEPKCLGTEAKDEDTGGGEMR